MVMFEVYPVNSNPITIIEKNDDWLANLSNRDAGSYRR